MIQRGVASASGALVGRPRSQRRLAQQPRQAQGCETACECRIVESIGLPILTALLVVLTAPATIVAIPQLRSRATRHTTAARLRTVGLMAVDAWNVVGSVAALIAAIAALVTVRFARDTVIEARRTREELRDDHAEEMRAHAEAMTRQELLLNATRTASEQELLGHHQALARDLWLQRVTQIGRLQEQLGEAGDIARTEIANPPERIVGQPGTWTRLTSALARVEAAAVIFELLGGPPLDDVKQMAKEGRRMNTPPARVVGETMSALERTRNLAETDPSLKQPDGASR